MHRSAQRSSGPDSIEKARDPQIVSGHTIAAISTPAGEGAIALVRLSGADAIDVAGRIFRGNKSPSQFPSHVQYLGEITGENNELIDQVMLSVHRAPASYTGEDLIEISCHGGMLVSAKVLEACLRAGAQAARAGEFTERAFLNGKMDLTQAEAVIDLIRARTDLALRSATEQLQGKLGQKANEIRNDLVALIANIEASIEFPEEGIRPEAGEELIARFDLVRDKISILLTTADQGRILREGVRVVIYGATNAGKSSLLNQLLGYERVIVSETHGTTRDTIEEMINLRGVPIRLLDTAGLRAPAEEIEREGIARTEKSLATADLLLHIADQNAAKPPHFEERPRQIDEVPVLNKGDLPEHQDWKSHSALRISCVTGEGIPELEDEILRRVSGRSLHPESGIAINLRHRDCLRRALESCEHARAALLSGVSPEYTAVDLNTALRAVGEIVGEVDNEQILDSVFGQFCIGK